MKVRLVLLLIFIIGFIVSICYQNDSFATLFNLLIFIVSVSIIAHKRGYIQKKFNI